MNAGETSSIGEIAQRFGLATHVLRHWESMGLLAPARFSGQRRYTVDDMYRVAAIVRSREAGLSLEQILQMITTTDPASRVSILRGQRDELQRRITATQEALQIIESVLNCRYADFTQCPNYRALITDKVGACGRLHSDG